LLARAEGVILMITRRHFMGFLASGLVAAPLTAEAQGTRNAATIGFLSERSLPPPYLEALRRGLTERGWAEGRSFRIEQRSAEGDLERLPGLVAELIGIGVTVIVTGIGTLAALAAKRATAKIPIVFVTGGDPVDFGIISNKAKPGGNITGFGGGITAIQKRLDLLRDRILRGAPAGDLPVEEAVKFEVVINLKAVQALGLTIPASLRQEAEM